MNSLEKVLENLPNVPISFQTDMKGNRTHVVIPLVSNWADLPEQEFRLKVNAILAAFAANEDAYLRPAPVNNPIRKARLDAGITQAALAERLNISQPALSKHESERRKPSAEIVERAMVAIQSILKEKI